MKNLESLYFWFDSNRDKIIKNHEGEQVLISDEKVIDYYSDEKSAMKNAFDRGFKYGEFLVQWCVPLEKESMANYYQEIKIG